MSKGSNPRPIEVDPQTYADNWERTFGSDGARVGAKDGSNPSNVGAIPTAPANSIAEIAAKLHACMGDKCYCRGHHIEWSEEDRARLRDVMARIVAAEDGPELYDV